MANPSVEWFKGLSPEGKKSFEQTLRNTTLVFDRLNDILTEWERSIEKKSFSEDDLEGNWQLKQVFRYGDLQRIRKMRELISFYKEP